MKRIALALLTIAIFARPIAAEPIGQWYSGFGQGTVEYGIKHDSAGSDYFYIACSPDFGTSINITVGGTDAPPGKNVVVTIGADEFDLPIGRDGYFTTHSHIAYDIFRTLWSSLRRGTVMRVRLANGQSTVFSLRGSGRILPKQHCRTDFER